MPSTAFKFPSSVSASTGWSSTSVSPSANSCTASLGTTDLNTGNLALTNFSFSIPTGATVVGIEVTVGRQTTGGSMGDFLVTLRVDGTVVGDSKNEGSWPGTSTTQAYGGASDTWGLSAANLTAAKWNSSGSGINFRALNNNYFSSASTGVLTNLQMRIYYTEGGNNAAFIGWAI